MNIEMEDFKNEFDEIFENELTALVKNATESLGSSETAKYIQYLLKIANSGKRIRPYNTALLYTIYSGQTWHNIKNTLIGIELLHLMALVLDDIMDNSSTRHGVTSTHSYIRQDLYNKVNKPTAEHTSNSLATLLGLIVFAWAFAKFSKDNQTEYSWSVINTLIEEVIIGQTMDVYTPIVKQATTQEVENKMLLKTARYTFTRPLLLGAVCAGVTPEQANWITNFGDSLGLLFQTQDDIFDITKDVTILKKEPLGGIKNGIHTLLSTYIVQNATQNENETWAKWFGNQNTNNQQEIISFISSTGALSFAQQYINEKELSALDALSKSNLPETDIAKIKTLISKITKRDY